MLNRLALAVLLGTGGSVGVLAPVSVTEGGGLSTAVAECATCCAQPDATCVICGTESCVANSNYYEGKVGPGGCGGVKT